MNSNEEILNLKFKICDNINYIVTENKTIVLMEKQEHKIQKILRKLKFNIPEYKKIEFDEYCSTVFLMLNGENTVRKIGENLDLKYGQKVYPLYERLLLFLNHIYTNCNYIDKVN
ncbi:PqqD family peptide modification chaperone [Terrisporobacter sp.]